jgi:hypothetical protein
MRDWSLLYIVLLRQLLTTLRVILAVANLVLIRRLWPDYRVAYTRFLAKLS